MKRLIRLIIIIILSFPILSVILLSDTGEVIRDYLGINKEYFADISNNLEDYWKPILKKGAFLFWIFILALIYYRYRLLSKPKQTIVIDQITIPKDLSKIGLNHKRVKKLLYNSFNYSIYNSSKSNKTSLDPMMKLLEMEVCHLPADNINLKINETSGFWTPVLNLVDFFYDEKHSIHFSLSFERCTNNHTDSNEQHDNSTSSNLENKQKKHSIEIIKYICKIHYFTPSYRTMQVPFEVDSNGYIDDTKLGEKISKKIIKQIAPPCYSISLNHFKNEVIKTKTLNKLIFYTKCIIKKYNTANGGYCCRNCEKKHFTKHLLSKCNNSYGYTLLTLSTLVQDVINRINYELDDYERLKETVIKLSQEFLCAYKNYIKSMSIWKRLIYSSILLNREMWVNFFPQIIKHRDFNKHAYNILTIKNYRNISNDIKNGYMDYPITPYDFKKIFKHRRFFATFFFWKNKYIKGFYSHNIVDINFINNNNNIANPNKKLNTYSRITKYVNHKPDIHDLDYCYFSLRNFYSNPKTYNIFKKVNLKFRSIFLSLFCAHHFSLICKKLNNSANYPLTIGFHFAALPRLRKTLLIKNHPRKSDAEELYITVQICYILRSKCITYYIPNNKLIEHWQIIKKLQNIITHRAWNLLQMCHFATKEFLINSKDKKITNYKFLNKITSFNIEELTSKNFYVFFNYLIDIRYCIHNLESKKSINKNHNQLQQLKSTLSNYCIQLATSFNFMGIISLIQKDYYKTNCMLQRAIICLDIIHNKNIQKISWLKTIIDNNKHICNYIYNSKIQKIPNLVNNPIIKENNSFFNNNSKNLNNNNSSSISKNYRIQNNFIILKITNNNNNNNNLNSQYAIQTHDNYAIDAAFV